MSSNWIQLQRTLSKDSKGKKPAGKRRKRDSKYDQSTSSHNDNDDSTRGGGLSSPSPSLHHQDQQGEEEEETSSTSVADGSVKSLRKMVGGYVQFSEKHRLPGRYLAVDCEMVGVGPDGVESSLARVSMVNFYGAVIMDEYVKQRERVVDYRTQYSGIRPGDMVHAKPFEEVQKQVAELLKDRVLVGHAVHNDSKALLLSHPYPLTRDTQILAFKSGLTKSKRIALRNLVKQELDLTIQAGEHSSVTDARATMAVYRLHKKTWDGLLGASSSRPGGHAMAVGSGSGKRKASVLDGSDDDGEAPSSAKGRLPGPAGRKGVSSGLSTIVRHGSGAVGKGKGKGKRGGDQEKDQWWTKLPANKTRSVGSTVKGSLKL